MATDMATLQETFGDKVRARRQELGMNQKEFAEKLDMHQPDVCNIENGKHAPTLTTVERIAKVLKVKPGSLLG
jgi:transcriptional regulator with XRE-family HTH domain